MIDRRQLILNLHHRPAFGREDFFVSSCNEEAIAYIDLWPDWPAPLTWLCGAPGSGKSHLAAVWQEKSGACHIKQSTVGENIKKVSPDFCIFTLDLSEGIENEILLLNFYNVVAEYRGSILVTAFSPPARSKFSLPDLGSRLKSSPVINLKRADDGLLEAVLIKLFTDRQLKVQAEVIPYLVRRMDRSIAAAQEIVSLIDDVALAEKKMITVPLVRSIIKNSDFGT
tara:strand:- start:244 stop:921 length:678 start_codon:yes stop_codon:yes gene_type:complete